MANKKITQLVNKTTILSTDLFPIGDATTGQLYKKTVAELQAAIGGAVISVNAKVGTVVLTTDDVLETVSPANQYFTTTRSRASVSATTPLAYNSSTGVFSIPVATTSANGYLSSTDWTTFNGKENVLTFSSPLVRTTNTISIPVATTSVNGYLSSTDWTTFNNKQGALTLTVTGSSGASTLVGTTLNIPTYTLAGLGGITATFLSAGAGITYSSSTGIIASTITQYTDALARSAHSFTAGSGAYNSTTGVITIPTNTSQLTNGAAFITLTSLSGSTGISYNSTTGAISSTITQYTDALARASLSFTAGSGGYNSTTGVITIPTNTSQLTNGAGFITGITSGNVTTALGYTPVTNARTLTIQGTTYDLTADRTWTISGTLSGLTTNYIPKATGANSLGNSSLINDASGNLGLGVTPSAWGSASTVIQLVGGGSLVGRTGFNSFGRNIYYNSSDLATYIASDYASNYLQISGEHRWYNAPSSTAGSTITFTQAMTLTNGGNLLVGTTTDSGYKLDVNGTGRFNGALNISAAGIDLTTADTIYFSHPSYPTTYRNKISTSVSGNASYQLMVLSVANGASTYNNILTLNGSGAATFSGSVTAGNGTFSNGANSTSSVTIGGGGGYGVGLTNTLIINTPNGGGQIAPAFIDYKVNGTTTWKAGINSTNNGQIYYRISDASADRLVIDTSGNVGIGTASPASTLTVVGDIRINSGYSLALNRPDNGAAGSILLNSSNNIIITSSLGGTISLGTNATFSNGITASGGLYLKQDSTTANQITISGLTDVNKQLIIGYYTTGNGYSVIQSVYQGVGYTPIVLQQNGGNILLGTTTDNGERLYVSGAIRATGTITANSDIRLKKNLERIENALEKVGQISGYTYNTIYDDKRHGGVIAQEIDEVFPEIVNKGNDGLLGVEYGNISALLIEALKEATTKIKALESKVEALQNL